MATKRLIGKLYRAGEEVADNSEQGLCQKPTSPDAKSLLPLTRLCPSH